MYLILDVSANGDPKNWKRPADDVFNWPRLTQLSWLVYNEERELVAQANDLIKPQGWKVPKKMETKYHLTTEKLEAEGIPVREALEKLVPQIDAAKYIIAHNVTFCEGVLTSEMTRLSMPHRLEVADKYALMQEAAWYTKLPARGGRYKWPSLQDIHVKMFQARYANAGEAYADVATTAIVFFGLLDLEAIELF